MTTKGPKEDRHKGHKVIVFLHGGGVGGWMWRPAIAHLPEYRCLAPDLPGHGGSRGAGPFTMERAALEVAALIGEQAAGGRAHVVGLSEGAQVIVQLLATAPEVVERAVISSALLRPIPGLGWVSSPALLAWAYRLSMQPLRHSQWWIRLNMKYAAGIPDAFYPEFERDWQQMTEPEFVDLMVANQRFRLPAGLERVDVPALVVAGKREYGVMKQSVRDLVAALPRAQGGLIDLGPGATLAREHNWALTAPELFAQTVRAWIEGQPLPAAIKTL